MSRYLLIYIISLLYISVKLSTAALTYRKFVYQKDMSEYCRRRVMPTVFLGRQVVDANSQILHFSRLEEPYSCFITIRTEMGSNIIMVIQVITGTNIQESCKKGYHQLFIHELGETFGGYWGQMPDSVMQQVKGRDERTYTLKPSSTEPPTTTTKRARQFDFTSPDRKLEAKSLCYNGGAQLDGLIRCFFTPRLKGPGTVGRRKHVSCTTTTPSTTTPTTTADEDDSAEEDNEGYLTLEVPILNVSARIVPGKLEIDNAFSIADTFDVAYDVTPRAGELYETKEVPLLEIGVKKSNSGGRYGDDTNGNSSIADFKIELNEIFTSDPRLLLLDIAERTSKRKLYKYRPDVSGRLDFKKNNRLFVPKGALHKRRPSFTARRQQLTYKQNNYVSKLYNVKHESVEPIHTSKESKIDSKPHYWDAIHDILKNLSRHSDVSTEPPHKELANILRGINNKKLTKSVYLSPNLSYIYLNTPVVPVFEHSSTTTGEQPAIYKTLPTTLYQLNTISKTTSALQDSSKLDTKSNTGMNNSSAIIDGDGATLALLPLALDVDSIILNATNQIKSSVQNKQPEAVLKANATPSVEKLDSLPVSLVDHESFENVVQSASAMATMLNITKATSANKTKREVYVTKPKRRKMRKKRYLHAIEIEGAQPHREQQMKHESTTSASEIFNMRQFQSLVELQDDEIQDHVAMRYLPQLMAPPLLDFCNFNDTAMRYVYLFNSSRLVLALSNFTLRRMTVVVTPAQILSNGEDRCGEANIECQVSGARVCIDSLSACDGVPNCGSYDIYDEDRLSCGSAPGYRHNVYLAAITFLAVMLTLLYTIHYWLTRYIPKVSEAFFIYTDAAENVLYLDSIMKSPHDIGVGKDFLHGAQQLFGYGDISVKKNVCTRFMNRCLTVFRSMKKRTQELDTADLDQLYSERISPFVPMDLTQMSSFLHYGVDVAVQTDSKEEMTILPTTNSEENFSLENFLTTSIEPTGSGQVNSDSNQPSDELNMLQFLRKARGRSVSAQHSDFKPNFNGSPYKSQSSRSKLPNEEKGMPVTENKESATETVTIERPQVSKPVVKHLRFQDESIIIPNEDDELDDDDALDENVRITGRRSIVFGVGKIYQQESKPNEFDEQITGSTGRELKSYFNWGSGKEKKKKKSNKKK